MATKHQGTPKDKMALDLFIKLMRTHDSLETRLRQRFKTFELSPGQFGILETLYHLGPMHQCVLGTKLLKTAGNITRILDGMQDSGLIERLPDPEDRRAFRVHLTAKGKSDVEKIFPEFVRETRSAFACLTTEEQAQLNEILRKLGTNLKHSLINE